MSTQTAEGRGIRRFVTDGSVSEAVVLAVAEAKCLDPRRIDPLYEAVDPDALDALFACAPAADGVVTFSLAGCSVRVHSGGLVHAAPLEEA